MIGLLWTSLALASPQTVLAVGDPPLVAVVPASPVEGEPTRVLDTWMGQLSDCLTEGRAEGFVVQDRRAEGETVQTLAARVPILLGSAPAHVVVTLAARTLVRPPEPPAEPDSASAWTRLIDGLQQRATPPTILLVAPIAPDGAPDDLAARIAAHRKLLGELAARSPNIAVIDVNGAVSLSEAPGLLSERGNAHLAHVICQAILVGQKQAE